MAKEKYTPPKQNGRSFHCPHCGVYAHQYWTDGNSLTSFLYGTHRNNVSLAQVGVQLSLCHSCFRAALWIVESEGATGKLVYPVIQDAPPPNPDMSPKVKGYYKEAAAIKRESPRAAAAVLRLALEQMCDDVCGKEATKGKTLQQKIDLLVADGLPRRLIQSMDTVRILGNDAVHPTAVQEEEDEVTVEKLFLLVNFIADKLITEKREIDAINAAVPDSKKRKNLPPKEGEGG